MKRYNPIELRLSSTSSTFLLRTKLRYLISNMNGKCKNDTNLDHYLICASPTTTPYLFCVGLEALGGRFLRPFSIAFSGSSVDPLDLALVTNSEFEESNSFLHCGFALATCTAKVERSKGKSIKNRSTGFVVWLLLIFYQENWNGDRLKWQKAENGSSL